MELRENEQIKLQYITTVSWCVRALAGYESGQEEGDGETFDSNNWDEIDRQSDQDEIHGDSELIESSDK